MDINSFQRSRSKLNAILATLSIAAVLWSSSWMIASTGFGDNANVNLQSHADSPVIVMNTANSTLATPSAAPAHRTLPCPVEVAPPCPTV